MQFVPRAHGTGDFGILDCALPRSYKLMLRSRQILRMPGFASGRKRVGAIQVIRSLAQGQALRAV
jgi:hypothetical protein